MMAWIDDLEYGGAELVPCSEDFWNLPLGPGPRRPAHVLAAMPYGQYLESNEWQETRRKTLTASDHRCAECGNRAHLHVHHLTYERLGGEYPADLEVLCYWCHRKEHGLG